MAQTFSWSRMLGTPSAKRPRKNLPVRQLCARAVLKTVEPRTLLSTVNIAVTTLADSGAGSLRAAVTAADNNNSGDDIVINLASLSGVITLTSAFLELTARSGTTTLTGPGAKFLSISGNNNNTVFVLLPGITATISGLTITGGDAASGGGIFNEGTLNLTNSTVSGDFAATFGGGIINYGTMTLTNSTVSGDTASMRGGGIYNQGNLTLTNSTVSGDSATTFGGGISNEDTLNLTNSTVSGDSARYGGGIFNEGTFTLTNSTISDDTASMKGGGIRNVRTLTVTNSTVSGDSATTGGGIINYGTMTLTNSTLSGDSATSQGGGIYNYHGTITLTNSTISGDSARYGGGIYNTQGTTTLIKSTVSSDSATRKGGGIFDNQGTMAFINSAVSGDSASYGGGIYNYHGTMNLANSTVSGDSATTFGGGIYNYHGTMNLANSTVSGDSATTFGGGIDNVFGTFTLTNCTVSGNSAITSGGLVNNGSTLTLNNTIVAGNHTPAGGTTPSDISNTPGTVTGSHNLIGAGGAGGLTNGTNGNLVGVIVANLKLGPLLNNGGPTQTMALLAGSPAIDAGSNTLAKDPGNQTLTTDQRGSGFPRIINGTVDIGAFESPGPESPGPEITVLMNNTSLANNAATPTDLGTKVQYSVTSPLTFTIRNDGTANLTVSAFTASPGFTLVQTPSSPIAPGASATLLVKLNSSAVGSKIGTLQFTTNDADGGDGIENPFLIHLTGTVTQPAPGELFIRQVYRDVLKREADSGGLAYWLGFYNAGHTFADIATAITSSREYDGIVVDSFYVLYLGRHSELAGLNIWVDQMQGGLNAEVIRAGILASLEYYNRIGGTDSAYITILYSNFLHRTPDSGGLAIWIGQLDHSSPAAATNARIVVSSAISNSQESRTTIVTGFYQTYLHRNPDPAGLLIWITNLANGISQPQIISFFVTAPEYLAINHIT